MIEYVEKIDGDTLLACFAKDNNLYEVPIPTDVTEENIQNLLSIEVAETERNLENSNLN
tara:strand:+ start:767 stop:943 length:177 start_codon:yes stop_codon:yes gene_type:complete